MSEVQVERFLKALRTAQRAEWLTHRDRKVVGDLIRWLEKEKERVRRPDAEQRRRFRWEAAERICRVLLKSCTLLELVAKWFSDHN